MTPKANVPTFTVYLLDGGVENARLLPFQQIAYERDTGEPLFSVDESISMEKVYMLAWYAADQPDTFDEWVRTLEAVTMVEDGDEDDNAEGDTPST